MSHYLLRWQFKDSTTKTLVEKPQVDSTHRQLAGQHQTGGARPDDDHIGGVHQDYSPTRFVARHQPATAGTQSNQ